MRLITRSDFDGLASAVLLKSADLVDDVVFLKAPEIDNAGNLVERNDILANIPYVDGCGLWFDPHTSEFDRLKDVAFDGRAEPLASCARVIWSHYRGHETFSSRFDPLLEAVDRLCGGDLTRSDINAPAGWMLLGFLVDPRTGLGRYLDYTVDTESMMTGLVAASLWSTIDEILAMPAIQERTDRYIAQQELFSNMIRQTSRTEGNVLIIDLRNQQEIFPGNRFTAYALYPKTNVSIQAMWNADHTRVGFTVGRSVLNRTSEIDVGRLLMSFGGGGRARVGYCEVAADMADQTFSALIDALKDDTSHPVLHPAIKKVSGLARHAAAVTASHTIGRKGD